jgi:hypothetical protein
VITIQYLEDAPELSWLEKGTVVEKLRAAGERLPFSHLLIGWHLPPHLLEACRREAERLGVRFLRWHPLLTGDTVFQPRPGWRVVGLTGRKVTGYRTMSAFTFVCPNHPEVREAIRRRMEALLREGMYQGFFLDRVRFPSPAANPLHDLGCFCEHCRRKAEGLGVDLEQVRRVTVKLMSKEQGRLAVIQALLGGKDFPLDDETIGCVRTLLNFRSRSVTDFVSVIFHLLKEGGMEIGLDCFSPGLAGMVGQDIAALSGVADWIKVMSYGHSLGPAGLPFELLSIHDYLSTATGLKEAEAFQWIGEAVSLPLPATRRYLECEGLSPQALGREVVRGVKASKVPLLAGVELVEIEGVAHLNAAQIKADLAAVKRAGAGGLSISWDLRHIPLDRLDVVKQVYLAR